MIEGKIGSFAAYIRKNVNSQNGVKTQFFGEDGDDADIISVLAQTKFKGLEVGLSVYWIKDGVGRDMKDDNGAYPLITSFVCTINRPKPSSQDDGMIAEFFAHDGENSDKANELNKSKYKDALVFVDIRGKLAFNSPNIYEQENQDNIVQNHAWKVSEKEKREYQKMTKRYLKINISLHENNVFMNEGVIEKINAEYPLIEFMKLQSCVFKHNGHLCEKDASRLIKIENNYYLPFCDEHAEMIKSSSDYACVDHGSIYLQTEYMKMVQRWAWGFFIQRFSLTGHEEPNSIKIFQWFEQNDLQLLMPQKFKKDCLALLR